MSFTFLESISARGSKPPETAATAPSHSALNRRSPLGLLKKLIMSLAVWMLYVPNLAIIKMLGPRIGSAWARGTGRIHWLLTYLGAQRTTRAILENLHPHLQTSLSVSTILRKHLEMKHEYFARIKLFNCGGDSTRQSELVWEFSPTLTEQINRLATSDTPLILVGYHFGFFRLLGAALSRHLPGCDAVHVSHRSAHYSGDTLPSIAQLALRRAIAADRQSGAKIHYIDTKSSLLQLCRMLRAGEIIAMGADGSFANDFLDVPFMGAKLRVPCGWARLAAATRANVLILADTQVDPWRRRVLGFEHVQVEDSSPEAIYRAVAAAARILEDLVRREPWAWHPWQRLRTGTTEDGLPLLAIAELGPGQRPETSLGASRCADTAPKTNAQARHSEVGSSKLAPGAPCNGGTAIDMSDCLTAADGFGGDFPRARRVAIVANSFTPYRIYVHGRIVREVPEVELWTVMTHGNSYNRWQGLEPPAEIRPVMFGNGEPTIEQTKLKFALREWRKFGRIIRWLDEHRIEAVICQGFGDVGRLRLLRWCRRRGIPCFLTADCNICGDARPGPKRLAKHLVVGQAIRWSSGVMPCGEYGRLLFERYGATRDKTFMFPLISNLELLAQTPAEVMRQVREQYGFDPERRRILYCGRMMKVKRPDLTISAFVALAQERLEWDLVMIGEGPLRQSAEASVPAHLRDRVKWLGLIHDTVELASVYAQCDVLALPADKEPWGMVVIEAAASGMALVMTDIVGASPELVSDGENGRVFPPGDLKAFISALREVTHPERIDEMKSNSRRVLSRWMVESDPVDGFRAAMASCGLLPRHLERRTAGPTPDPVPREALAENEILT